MLKYFFILLFLLLLLSVNRENFKMFYKTIKINKKNRFSGLNGYDSFILEEQCLTNLSKNYKCKCKKKRNHFPKINNIKSEKNNKKIIYMSHLGESINKINSKKINQLKKKNNFKEQINCILQNLNKSNTYHNDMHLSGKNMTINDTGDLGLIDFNIANTKGFKPKESNGNKLKKRTLDSKGKIKKNNYGQFYKILHNKKLV